MRLLSLTLKNIRSYTNHTISFPEGITLLSGDIGAGKSTLLLAIEFALFGINRGELTGSALLRHGATEGAVAVRFTINNKEYTIQRTLKKTTTGATQDNGWIETQNTREQLTPSELRARIYELLGYPLQFLSKQRNILYRFTIYTPQEEMKAILSQDVEERLETVRRIFGIDAYKTARDNAHLVGRALKERETLHENILIRIKNDTERLKQKLLREPQIEQQKNLLFTERNTITVQFEQQEQLVAQLEQQRSLIQQQLQVHAMQERNKNLAEQELKQLLLHKDRKNKLLHETTLVVEKLVMTKELLAKEIAAQQQEQLQTKVLDTQQPHTSQRSSEQLQHQLHAIQEAIGQLRKDEGKLLRMIEECNHKPGVAAGTNCPTCRQLVPESHLDDAAK